MILNIISNKKNIGELNNENNFNLLNNIIKESEIFVEKNKNILFKIKFNMIDFFINKIRDENYTKKEKIKNEIIDPVNDYIMNKKYKQNFRKSKVDIKQNKKDKKNKKNLKNKKQNLNINNLDDIINIDNIEMEKEVIKLNKENKENNFDKKILNKKVKRNNHENNKNN